MTVEKPPLPQKVECPEHKRVTSGGFDGDGGTCMPPTQVLRECFELLCLRFLICEGLLQSTVASSTFLSTATISCFVAMESACRHTDSSASDAETIFLSSNFSSVAVSIQRLLVDQRGSGTGTFMLFAYYVVLCCFQRYLQLRHERRKQREFVDAFEKHRKAERDAVAELHSHHVDPAAASASKPDGIPRRSRSSGGAKKAAANAQPRRSDGETSFTGDHDAPGFASLSMALASVRETTSHVISQFKSLAVDGVESVTRIRALEGHIGQTQVQLSVDILTRLHNIAAEGIRSDDSFRLQLGYSQLYVKPSASGTYPALIIHDRLPCHRHASF